MTTDEFDTRYKLLKQITTGEGRSFTAQECASGRAVLVHFLAENESVPGSSVPTLVARLEPRDRSKILEVLAVDQSTVVVTQFLEDFEGFDAWLRGRLAAPPAPAPEVSPPPVAGDFTRMFDPAAVVQTDAHPAPVSSPEPVASPAPPPVGHQAQEGGFTELFRPPPAARTGPAPIPVPPPVPPPSAAPPPPSAKTAPEAPPGGFTELFRPPPESRTGPLPLPAPLPAPPPAPPPLELRSVRIPLGQPPPPPPRPVTPPPAWPSAPTFEPPPPPPSLKPVVPVPRLGPRPGEPIVKPPVRDARPAAVPLPAPGWSGESDYTRQLRPVPNPAEPAQQASPAPRPGGAPAGLSEPAPPPKSIVPLLLILNIVVVIATGVILYFALKRP